ncbi:hypothetical protein TRFO_35452 [Tritrichomonas foetus]|uniref:Uncharacterized protein n=1 Tax=Tritrichomonas foetus TaxID=1144522 RepID=A0A1J4JG99_9EUKA|nr:hypothetical protein TRFO_35452 [Tritrichomonas foetus]|eukprot:OHS98214.1 hypothetical protein TRFO_35452 [Tritrichomonas foetus]
MKRRSTAPVTLPKTQQETPTTICEKMINLILTNESEFDNDLIKILATTSNFYLVLNTMSNSISSTPELPKQILLFRLYIKILLAHQELNIIDPDEVLVRELKMINMFPLLLPTIELYDSTRKVIEFILDHFQSIDDTRMNDITSQPEGSFRPYILSIYAARSKKFSAQIFNSILEKAEVSSSTKMLAITTFFQSHKLEDMNEEQKLVFTNFGGEQKVNSIIRELVNGETIQQRISIRMIAYITHFLKPEAAVVQFLDVLQPVIAILNRSDNIVRLEVANMLKCLPPNIDESIISNEKQIKSILCPICEYLTTFEGEYADAILHFTEPRKEYKHFSRLIEAMFVSYQTSYAALMLSQTLDILSPKMLKAAFPKGPVTENRIKFTVAGINYVISHDKLEKNSFKGVVSQILQLYKNEAFLANPELKATALDGIDVILPHIHNYYVSFAKLTLKNLGSVKDYDMLKCYSNCGKTLQSDIDTNNYSPKVETFAPWFCNIFLTLFGQPNAEAIFFQLLRIFSPTIVEKPKSLFNAVPEPCKEYLKKYAFDKLKSEPKIAIVCALIPRLTDKDLNKLVKVVTHVKPFDHKIYESFFICLSKTYLEQSMKILADLSIGKKLSSTIFTGKQKKQDRLKLVITTLQLIPKLIAENQFNAKQQKHIYEIIMSTLPKHRSKIMKIATEAKKMNDVFTNLPLTKPPSELSKRLIKIPLFADSIPILVQSLSPSESLSQTIVNTWIDTMKSDPTAYTRTLPILTVILTTSPTPKTLAYILSESSKCFSDEKYTLSFIEFCMNTANVAREMEIKFCDTTHFMLHLAPLALSTNPSIRYAAFQTFYDLSLMESNKMLREEIGEVLSPAQLKDEVISMFLLVAKAISPEQCSNTIKCISEMKEVSNPHALYLRAILSARNDYLDDPNTYTNFVAVIKNHDAFHKAGITELEKGLMALGRTKMNVIVPMLMTLNNNSSYRKHLILLFLTSHDHRDLFLDQFHDMIVHCEGNLKSMALFHILPKIIKTEESSDVSPHTFGTIVAEIMVMIAFVYKNTKELGKSGVKSACEEISNCIEKILQKTSLEKKAKIPIVLNDKESISNSIAKIAENISKLEVSKLKNLHHQCNIMLQSPNQVVLLVAGILDIHMYSYFFTYKNRDAKELNTILASEIGNSFAASNISTRRFLAKIMPNGGYELYHTEDLIKIFKSMTESLANANNSYFSEASEFLANILPFIPNETVAEDTENLINTLKNLFQNLRPSKALMYILERYLDVRCEVADFIGDAPNIGTLLTIGMTEEAELSNIAWNFLCKLKGDVSVCNSILEKCPFEQIQQLASQAMKNSARFDALDSGWYDLICDLAEKIMEKENVLNNDPKSGGIFHGEVLPFTLPAASDKNNKNHKRALDLLTRVWK